MKRKDRNQTEKNRPLSGKWGALIAIASGKGGVGKSTVTVNMAFALKNMGYSVGILDADIYGPSLGKMLGVEDGTRPEVAEHDGHNYYVPLDVQGLQVMSMALLADEKTPMIWRGPMASGALQQMLLQTWWEKPDFLLVDLPPGTGDIQLTLSQKASLNGAVIVTTPQDLALLDARRAMEMFEKVNVPVLGVVENMAFHVCTNCGTRTTIFGQQGAERLFHEYGTACLGSLPLESEIRECADHGISVVNEFPDSKAAKEYLSIAENMVKQMESGKNMEGIPTLHIDDEN